MIILGAPTLREVVKHDSLISLRGKRVCVFIDGPIT